jgi:hypothetical protein
MTKETVMANQKLTVDQILRRGEVEGITPYQIAQLVNAELLSAGRSDLEIRPQMMYNYSKNGMIVKGVKEGAHKYTVAQATAYATAFAAKRIQKNTVQVQVEEVDTTSDTEIEEFDSATMI